MASNKPDPRLVQAVIDLSDGHKVTLDNLIQHKFNREVRIGPKKDMGLILNIANHAEPVLFSHALDRDGTGISVEWFKTWLEEERLPEGLSPPETLGLLTLLSRVKEVGKKIDALHGEAANNRRDA